MRAGWWIYDGASRVDHIGGGPKQVTGGLFQLCLCQRRRLALLRTNGTVDGLFLGDDPTLAGDSGVRARVIEFAREQHLPSATTHANYAREGGLLSYGVDMGPIFRSAAEYVHRILHGARPNELPVQIPTKFELVINLKTAKALGLTVPPSILLRADEVIE